MRAIGTIVAFVGLALAVGFTFLGCGSLFAWNGRHVVGVHTITPGSPLVVPLTPEPGRRYTASVQVVFEREEERAPAAKMSVTARAIDKSGATIVETFGWIDPDEPPTVLHGAHPNPRGEQPELVAERLVGSFNVSSPDPIEVRVDLGPDRTGVSRVAESRLVLYDDATPPGIRRALVAAVAGAVVFLVGFSMVFVSFFRGRKRRRRRQ